MHHTLIGESNEPVLLKDHVDALPNELLTEIFLLITGPRSDSVRRKDSEAHVLMSVCRRWRSIVVSIPTFWRVIRITPSKGPYEEFDLLLRLETLTTRAGLETLHIIWDHPPEVEVETFTKLIYQLFRHANIGRWREMTIFRSQRGIQMPNLDGQTFSNLERLSLKMTSLRSAGNPILALLDTCNANIKQFSTTESSRASGNGPRFVESVTDVELLRDRPGGSFGFTEGIFPHAQILRVYWIRGIPLTQFSHLRELHVRSMTLRELERLSAATLEAIYIHLFSHELQKARDEVCLPSLKTLQVSDQWLFPLYCIDAPNLELLRLSPRRWNPKNFTEMMKRMHHAGYSLSPTDAILESPLTTGALTYFLKRSPRLEKLSFALEEGSCEEPDNLVDVFSFSRGKGISKVVCPVLQTIRIRLHWDQAGGKDIGLGVVASVDWEEIAGRILAARTGTPLTSVTYEWMDGYEVTVRATRDSVV